MLCNCWLKLHFIFFNTTMLRSCRKILPNRATLQFLLVVQSKLLVQGFQHLLCRFPCAETTQNILVMMKFLKIFHHVVDCDCSIVPVLYHTVKIIKVLESHYNFCEGNPLPLQIESNSHCENWNHQVPQWLHPVTTYLRVAWLYGLLNHTKPGCGSIFT